LNLEYNAIINGNALLDSQNKTLTELLTELKAENAQLKTENTKKGLEEIRVALNLITERDEPITIREAMRMLERSLVYEAVKSNTQFGKYYNFDKVLAAGSPHVASFNAALSRYGLTLEHVDIIAYFKDAGDEQTHDGRPMLSRNQWDELLRDNFPTDTSEQADVANIRTKEILDALERFNPVTDKDSPWEIIDPVPHKRKILKAPISP
jgi:hypothetical protein